MGRYTAQTGGQLLPKRIKMKLGENLIFLVSILQQSAFNLPERIPLQFGNDVDLT